MGGLREVYGDRLCEVILFGSHARGVASSGSEIDIAVVLDDFEREIPELDRIEEVTWPLCLEHSVLIGSVPIRERDLQASQLPMMQNIRREGSPL